MALAPAWFLVPVDPEHKKDFENPRVLLGAPRPQLAAGPSPSAMSPHPHLGLSGMGLVWKACSGCTGVPAHVCLTQPTSLQHVLPF